MYVILMKVKYALISKSTLNLKSSIGVRYSYIKYLTRINPVGKPFFCSVSSDISSIQRGKPKPKN